MSKKTEEPKLKAIPFVDGASNVQVTLVCTEFTWVCPITNEPDYGTVEIRYTPLRSIVETVSLEKYLPMFRSFRMFNEYVAKAILGDFCEAIKPTRATVILTQNAEGGGGVTNKCEVWYP
jgi:7-cyano-7-deazaguanine reductase